MGTITGTSVEATLRASGEGTKTNVDSRAEIGASLTPTFEDADIAYSFSVTATGAGDIATLTLSSGAVAQTSGTPTITDAGSDFEGKALTTLVTIYGILVEITNPDDEVTFKLLDSAATIDQLFSAATQNREALFLSKNGRPLSTTTATLQFGASGDSAKITVIGKSS